MPYRVVQPWGDRSGQWTLISEHRTAAGAFDAIDRLSDRMVRTGVPSDAVPFIVVDDASARVTRPDAQ